MNPARIAAPDLVRGVAVLGILAVNIGGYAGPPAATIAPQLVWPATLANEAWFAFVLLVFEGKMRALLSMVFGAALLLSTDKAEAAGENGQALQIRRLLWLGVFGYLHWLLWWGDILFTYAVAGLAALAFRQLPARALSGLALGIFAAWHFAQMPEGLALARTEHAVLTGQASPAEAQAYAARQREDAGETADDLAEARLSLPAQLTARLNDDPGEPLRAALATIAETMPLMLLGMALCRAGFFARAWPAGRLRRIAIVATGSGAALTAAFVGLAWLWHFPPVLMRQALGWGLALPHLLMALGYAALLVLVAPRLTRLAPGRRLEVAGRMALTNYLGSTLVMTFCFSGWGLGLMGQVPPHAQGLFVIGGWALMLGLSGAWLSRYRLGPLEWAWRSLSRWEWLGIARPARPPAPAPVS